ncbi:MAG: ribosome assembly cofactor RimP [Bacteroidales bacterium 36-12]|nr:MAG: ribosome assembly cofactor RimP [Bacteroidales bacterium 36-12]
MIDKDVVNQVVESFIDQADIFVVDIIITNNNHISIEIDSFEGVSLDDCVNLSRYIESKIDREQEDYELEVSSAGLTSPFKIHKQYIKNTGKEVEVITTTGSKYTGVLKAVSAESIELIVDKTIKPEGSKRKITIQEEITILLQNIKTTKLIIRFK